MTPAVPATETIDRVAAILGWTPTAWQPIDRGYTPTARYVVRRGNESAFLKIATTPLTVRMMRHEIAAYRSVTGPFMADMLGADADTDWPILALEDLSSSIWPPPWTAQTLDAVLLAVAALHASTPSERMRAMEPEKLGGWAIVAETPDPFLALGLVDAGWLDRALPDLLRAEQQPPATLALCHFDLRSDNICIRDGRAVILDWAEMCMADPELDTGFMLPSLQFEGGPAPEDILPDAPGVAAQVSGFFAARAGLPDIPDAPFVRRVQREQLSTALPWVRRALGI
jgi:hypothetical protein